MKKLLSILLILSLSFAFYSCKDDNEFELEKYVWGGDWNDPDDPKYKPEYGGKYNPIQGLWQASWDNTYGLYFSEKFDYYQVQFYTNGSYHLFLLYHYDINDSALRYERAYNRYIIEGDKLYVYLSLNDPNEEPSIYIRVEE